MPKGKLASQAGHAFTDAHGESFDTDIARFHSYRCDHKGRRGSKVTLLAKNEAALRRALAEALEAGLPAALVIDSGHILLPHFDGSPVVTALGIGPCTKAECRHITKRFQAA